MVPCSKIKWVIFLQEYTKSVNNVVRRDFVQVNQHRYYIHYPGLKAADNGGQAAGQMEIFLTTEVTEGKSKPYLSSVHLRFLRCFRWLTGEFP